MELLSLSLFSIKREREREREKEIRERDTAGGGIFDPGNNVLKRERNCAVIFFSDSFFNVLLDESLYYYVVYV